MNASSRPAENVEAASAAMQTAEALAAELADAWQAGRRLRSEEFLKRQPSLRDHREAFLFLLCEEICLRQEAGEPVTKDELGQRFPDYRRELADLLDCQQLIGEGGAPAAKVGGDFVEVAELGRGAQGRVYLATQPALADRPVVLKVTPLQGHEHISLARLQHTHIVPLYWVQDDPGQNSRTLCMPYFGTVTLQQALELMAKTSAGRRSGKDLLGILDRAAAAAPLPLPNVGPSRAFLGRVSYVEAVCWLGACLADALHYAHERGLVHLDLKPSNILLAADGQPMLLDFHVAQEPIRPGGKAPEWVGGTPAFMSPEHRAALDAFLAEQPIAVAVDRRSDVYSLGLILYAALGGTSGEDGTPRPALEKCNPQVSPGLADILARCTARNPARRYPDAAELAADLRRHLANQPLRGVPNRSWRERWRKWRRRQPHALNLITLAFLIVALVVGVAVHITTRDREENERTRQQAQIALEEGKTLLSRHDYAKAVDTLERGLSLAKQIEAKDLKAAFEERLEPARAELRQTQQADRAARFRTLMNQIRLRHSQALNLDELRQLDQTCRGLWTRWKEILGGNDLAATDARTANDLLELAIITADVQVRSVPADSADYKEALRKSLATLSEAQALFGPRHMLYRQRQHYAEALGDATLARTAGQEARIYSPTTAWDHYWIGRLAYQEQDFRRAAVSLHQAVLLAPQDFWPNFYEGLTAHRLGKYADAVSAFRVCISLSPETAEAYYNRALAYAELGQMEPALQDYDAALKHQPNLAAAALNRGILYYQRKEYARALSDLQSALERGADPAAVHYNIALVYLAEKNRPAAIASVERALHANPQHAQAQSLRILLRKTPAE